MAIIKSVSSISYWYGRSRAPYFLVHMFDAQILIAPLFVSLFEYKYSDETVWSICSLCITAWNLPTTGRCANSTARTTSWNPGTRSLLPTMDTRSQQCGVSLVPCAWSNPPLTINSWKACGDSPQVVYGRWDGKRWDGGDCRTKDGKTKDAWTKDARTKDARKANSGYSLDGRTEPHLLEYLIYNCYF